MGFKNLPYIHTRHDAECIKDNVHRSAIREKWHIFWRKNRRDYPFVSVTTRKLVANLNLSQLCDRNLYAPDDSCIKLVACISREYFYRDNSPLFAVV